MEANEKAKALRLASTIGCSGAHKLESGEWVPCSSPEEFAASKSAIEPRSSLEEIETNHRKRTIKGRKKRKRQWENLGERGIQSIDTIDAGLVSGSSMSKDIQSRTIGQKTASLFVSSDLKRVFPLAFELSSKKLGKTIRRARIAITGTFDPNALDGDDDGLVQDGTAFERPNMPNIPKVNKPTQTVSQSPVADARRTQRRARQMSNMGSEPKKFTRSEQALWDTISSRKSKVEKRAEFRDWAKNNSGYYQELSPTERYVLSESLRNDGKRGFASSSGPVGSGGRAAGQTILSKVKPEHRNKPKRRLFFVGGTTGAGKSKLINDNKIGIPNDTEAAHIDPDEIKKVLVGYNNGKGASAVHGSSRESTDRIMGDASQAGMDMVVQGTGKRTEHLERARRNGYETVGHFVWIPNNVADKRIAQRNAYNEINGGPVLPTYFGSIIADELRMIVPRQITKGLYDEFYLWDNRGDTPKLIAFRKKDGSFQINDRESFDDFMSPAGSKYVEKYWKDNSGGQRSGLASRRANPTQYPLTHSLADIIDERQMPVPEDEEGPFIYKPGVPVAVQHVTDRKAAEKIMKKGYDLERAGGNMGSMFGHGIYLNQEGDEDGLLWAESMMDPVAMAATYTPQNPFVADDIDLDELSNLTLEEFATRYASMSWKDMHDDMIKEIDKRAKTFFNLIRDDEDARGKIRSIAGIDTDNYSRDLAGAIKFSDDLAAAYLSIYNKYMDIYNSNGRSAMKYDALSPDQQRIVDIHNLYNLGPSMKLSDKSSFNDKQSQFLDSGFWHHRPQFKKLIRDSDGSMKMGDALDVLLDDYISKKYDSLVTQSTSEDGHNPASSRQIVVYDPKVIKFDGVREVYS